MKIITRALQMLGFLGLMSTDDREYEHSDLDIPTTVLTRAAK